MHVVQQRDHYQPIFQKKCLTLLEEFCISLYPQNMAEETDGEQRLHRLFDQISKHLETRWAYFSLTSAEKASAIAANLTGAIVIFVFAVLVLFFFSMGFAWWLGDFIGNRAGGFALAGLINIPIAGVLFAWIRPFVRDKIIQAVLNEENNPTHD